MSFLTFQISMFFSASLGCGSLDDMVAVVCGGVDVVGAGKRFCPWARARAWARGAHEAERGSSRR
jgi:hypothetical protein